MASTVAAKSYSRGRFYILKREWWQTWDEEEVPDLIHVIQSYDTAFSKKETADFSAITTWGVFSHPSKGSPQIILLDAEKGRWEFTELKKLLWKNTNTGNRKQ
jgi:phage terminase large subunit-like protein